MDTLESPDAEALERWLRAELGGDGHVRLTRIGADTGVANALFELTWAGRRLVLRRPPASKITASAGDTSREARLLAALADTAVRHPRLVVSCADPTVLGSPFVLMEHVDGFTPVAPLPQAFATDPAARHAIGVELIDALAELALVDWRAVGLDGFGKPDGFLARQVDRWLWQLDSYRSREIPELGFVTEWLRDQLPDPGPIGIVHGDYSTFNVMFHPTLPPRLAAIVDWDTATIGEVLLDLGHVLARWDEDGEPPTTLGATDNPDRRGVATRAELAARYAARTGFPLDQLRYYEVLSLFKLGVIMEGHYAAELRAGTAPEAARFVDTSIGIIADAARIARGERS